jgi:hypothetical protein
MIDLKRVSFVDFALLADLTDDTNLSAEAQDAITKRHDGAAQDTAIGLKLDTAKLVAYDSSPSTGGAPSEVMNVAGLEVTDTILAVTQITPGASNLSIIGFSAQGPNALTITWTGDPGAGATVKVLVKKA